MASVSNLVLSVVRDVANAEITIDYDINWSSFDQLTNLSYTDTFRVIGDDTGEDGDDAGAGDDPVNLGLLFFTPVSSNGQPTTHRTKTKTIAFANLNEDTTLGALDNDDEIRAVVTLTPRLPVTSSFESNKVVVLA